MTADRPASSRAPIAVALDTGDLEAATRWTDAVAPHVRCIKVGLELFCACGPAAVGPLRRRGELELFLDLKLHDIPATVAGAARSVAPLAPTYLTVHAAGGPAMIAAAAEALPDTRIAGVTVLTSLSAADLARIGLDGSPAEAVARLAELAVGAGARALICSPREVALVRAAVGPDITLITPGVRPAGAGADDQARTSTPEHALADGADLLVIGRPITGAADPGEAAAAIAATVAGIELPNAVSAR
jgi:orotidine-5'-phosphate decarboxylase